MARRSRCDAHATIPDPNPPNRGPSPSQVRQSRELLVEASLTTSKNVKSKNVKWTDACFRVRSTLSEALTLSLTLTLALTLPWSVHSGVPRLYLGCISAISPPACRRE